MTTTRTAARALAAAAVAAAATVVAVPSASAAPSCPTIDPTTHVITSDYPLNANWSGCDLRGMDGFALNLVGANLAGADLTGASVAGSTLENVNLSGAVLTGVNANVSHLTGANVTGAALDGLSLYQATWTGLSGTPAALPSGAGIRAGYLLARDVVLQGIDLAGADLSHLDISGADLTVSTLTGADLTGVTAAGTRFIQVVATGVVAPGVDLSDAWTTSASFAGSHLEGAVLTRINGGQTDWSGIHASGASMVDARLSLSSMVGADVSGVDLTRASFTDADLTGLVATGATWSSTVCTDGYFSETHLGGTCLGAKDWTAPVTAMTAPATTYSINAALRPAWSTVETGVGLATGAYQWNRSLAGGPVSTVWSSDVALAPSTTSVAVTGAPGFRYCYRARFSDKAGNLGGFASSRCTTLPYDDVSLTASKGWVRSRTASGFLGRSYSASTTLSSYVLLNRTLTVRQVGIVATRCATCGSVAVYVGATKVGTISLRSSVAGSRVLLLLPRFSSARRGVVKLVVTSTRKLVRIDGVVVSGV